MVQGPLVAKAPLTLSPWLLTGCRAAPSSRPAARPAFRSRARCLTAAAALGAKLQRQRRRYDLRAHGAMAPLSFDPARRQVFVVGNEAADADSLVSAFALAMLLDSAEVQAVALAQIPREEFRLRGDALSLFRSAGVEAAPDGSPLGLHFWNEVDWQQVDALSSRGLVLTDHNKMTSDVAAHFDGRVELILDHHSDAQSHLDAKRIIDESLGSACTLVAEEWLAKHPSLPREVGLLLAGVIILDTRNFDPAERKGTPRDRAALDKLADFLPLEAAAWYAELTKARHDVSHLSMRELLLLDLKVASVAVGSEQRPVGFSAIMSTVSNALGRAGGSEQLVAEARRLAVDRGWDAAVSLFSKDERGRRSVVLVPATPLGQAACQEIVQRLRGAPGNLPKKLQENPLFAQQGLLESGFELEELKDFGEVLAFSLRGTVSRKTLLPCAAGPSAL